MDKEFIDKFLINRDETGRFIVTSKRTKRIYFVEVIDEGEFTDWGDFDPVSKKFVGEYGDKYRGSIKPEESLITKENGFEKIYNLQPGESPLDYINRIDDEYALMV